jgi:hypothetical protein
LILNAEIKRVPDWDATTAIVRVCLEYAAAKGRPVPPDLRDEADWRLGTPILSRTLMPRFCHRYARPAGR